VRELLDASGAVVKQYRYDSFGARSVVSGSGAVDEFFAYTGQARDPESGLQQHWHRYYDPPTGRWVSVDPVPDDTNQYRYVHNRPTNATDPSGLAEPDVEELERELAEIGVKLFSRRQSIGEFPHVKERYDRMERRAAEIKGLLEILKNPTSGGVNWAGAEKPLFGKQDINPAAPTTILEEYRVKTAKGSSLTAWKAIGKPSADVRYNCHGFTFDGLTPKNGPFLIIDSADVDVILKDMWKPIDWKDAKPRDIVVWNKGGTKYIHSARLTKVVLDGDKPDREKTTLDTKNGAAPFKKDATLASIITLYGDDMQPYTRK
jgi:RHS repeat-associated protein